MSKSKIAVSINKSINLAMMALPALKQIERIEAELESYNVKDYDSAINRLAIGSEKVRYENIELMELVIEKTDEPMVHSMAQFTISNLKDQM